MSEWETGDFQDKLLTFVAPPLDDERLHISWEMLGV